MRIKYRFFVIVAVSFCSVFFGLMAFADDTGKKQKDNPRAISSEAFLSSNFAKFLKNKQYPKALSAIDALVKKYPDDPLLLRYRGFTLEKLGRPEDAIGVYKGILSKHPDYAPAHLFLGLAYIKQNKSKEAARQLRWVIQNSPSLEYRRWAQAQLNRLRLRVRRATKPIKKKPYMISKIGVAYDSNPLLIPDDKILSSRTREGSALYMFDLDVGYPLQLKKDFRLDVLYIGQQRSHSSGAKQVDFTSQGFALDAKKRTFAGKRSVLWERRYDFRANFLRSDLFSIVNRFFLSLDTSFSKKTRTHLYSRFAVLNYGPDGSNPDDSSRDGIRGGLGATQYFYTPNLKTFFFLKAEGNFNQTRGENFVRRGVLTRLGFHTPLSLFKKTDLDMSAGFDWGTYPDFSSLSSLDLGDRRDNRLDVYTGITHHWKPNLATRLFYRFINSQNENDFFDRKRHIAGTEAIFSF